MLSEEGDGLEWRPAITSQSNGKALVMGGVGCFLKVFFFKCFLKVF